MKLSKNQYARLSEKLNAYDYQLVNGKDHMPIYTNENEYWYKTIYNNGNKVVIIYLPVWDFSQYDHEEIFPMRFHTMVEISYNGYGNTFDYKHPEDEEQSIFHKYHPEAKDGNWWVERETSDREMDKLIENIEFLALNTLDFFDENLFNKHLFKNLRDEK